eukprot:TRINITY_DN4836_c0_g1_i2.p1 TRINITY_DN4836_c0_g1~~TRINITY_DN4836_c0_g1_i2.p1  ORF type:complete len:141 (+),score=13.46 TRINITY_DN4836_c0_g1_i2:444-866(+)
MWEAFALEMRTETLLQVYRLCRYLYHSDTAIAFYVALRIFKVHFLHLVRVRECGHGCSLLARDTTTKMWKFLTGLVSQFTMPAPQPHRIRLVEGLRGAVLDCATWMLQNCSDIFCPTRLTQLRFVVSSIWKVGPDGVLVT